MKHYYLIIIALLCSLTGTAQQRYRALFIGNSYTYVNDLPHTIAQFAGAMGDTLDYDNSTPVATPCSSTVLTPLRWPR